MNNLNYIIIFFKNFINWLIYVSICIIFLIISAAKFWLYLKVFPFTVIIPIYCGHIYNQPFYNNTLIIILGILYDVAFNKPIGLTCSVLIILHLFLTLFNKKIRSYKFIKQVLLFMPYSLLYLIVSTILQILIAKEQIFPNCLLESLLLSWLIFPLFCMVFYNLTYKLKKQSIAYSKST
jgi:rod shape-determining protein MreD